MDLFPTKNSPYAFSTSVLVHVLILLALFFMVSWEVPDPPIGSLSVDMELAGDWGQSFHGQGDQETENPGPTDQVAPETPARSAVPVVQDNQTVTQTQSEVSAPAQQKPVQPKPVEVPEKPRPSDALNNALNQLSNPGGGGDGDDKQPGNTGTESGKIEGKGVFGGSGGGGGWSLDGRGMTTAPKLDDLPRQSGTVVVSITVDRNGKVISAKVLQGEGTATSDELFKLAEKAAYTARFDVKKDAKSPSQQGKLTFTFKLQ